MKKTPMMPEKKLGELKKLGYAVAFEAGFLCHHSDWSCVLISYV
jgi:hypothetical protein